MKKKKTYSSLSLAFFSDLRFDIFSDGQFDCALTDLGKIGAGKSFGHAGKIVQINLFRDGSLSEVSPEDGDTAGLVWKWDVNQLIQTTGTKNGRINNVGSVFERVKKLQVIVT